MRLVLVIAAAGALSTVSMTMSATPASAFCSVFSRHPCTPTACSVFRGRPCTPQYDTWIGQDLYLTIETKEPTAEPATSGVNPASVASDQPAHRLDSLREMFAALRACWVPPPQDEARHGMQ